MCLAAAAGPSAGAATGDAPVTLRAGSIRTESLKWTPVRTSPTVRQTSGSEPVTQGSPLRVVQRGMGDLPVPVLPDRGRATPAPLEDFAPDLAAPAPAEQPADQPAEMPTEPPLNLVPRVAPPADIPYEPPMVRGTTPPADRIPPISRQPNYPGEMEFKCPSPKDKDLFKKIDELSTDITAKEGEFPKECSAVSGPYEPRCWATSTFTWHASALCYHPLYFQQVQLERYGHSVGPVLQPIISGAQFFATIPALPYAMGLQPPCEHVYSLGYYRPGDCAPYILDPIPLSLRGALFQAGAVTGIGLAMP